MRTLSALITQNELKNQLKKISLWHNVLPIDQETNKRVTRSKSNIENNSLSVVQHVLFETPRDPPLVLSAEALNYFSSSKIITTIYLFLFY